MFLLYKLLICNQPTALLDSSLIAMASLYILEWQKRNADILLAAPG